MKDFKVGSHDTMTYLEPKKWWLKPFKFIAKCQSKTIEEQYNDYGIRLFDLRISYDPKTNELEFRHGAMAFKGDVLKTLEWLNSRDEKVYVRLILENTTRKAYDELIFPYDCMKFEKNYPKN